MYKNVRKQIEIAFIILFVSCFVAIQGHAQSVIKNQYQNNIDAGVDLVTVAGKTAFNPTTSPELTNAQSGLASKAATQVEDTTWKPVKRLWGYSFGDFYYDAHADAGNRGAETNYNGVPTYRNAFQFRRIYLGYDYDISRKFSVEMLLASEPSANTNVSGTTSISNGDNLVDNKMSFYIKLMNLKWKSIFKGSDLVMGEQLTPAFPMLSEKIWGYRSIEKTVSDFHKTNAFDIGAGLIGVFDPKTKNYGYDLLIGNNSQAALTSAANANTGFYKIFYGDVYAKFLKQTLIFDLYADYVQTAASSATIGGQSHNMLKGFAAYTTPKITFGLEAYTQQITNGLTNTTTGANETVTVKAFSLYSHGAIYKDKLAFFARYDSYQPDDSFSATDVYTINTNLGAYSPFTKEHFITSGLDYTPDKNVHFLPNLWFIQYQDQRSATATGYIPDSHVLVYRLTFFYTFGK